MGPARAAVGTDHVYPTTRLLAAAVVPFLLVASVILLARPGATDRLFVWTISPPFTAMLLGSAYLGGAYFFIRVLTERLWHRVALGFPPVIAFASLLGVATILHWDRFHHGHVAFLRWSILYFTTPFLVTAVWNRRTDTGDVADGDGVLPAALVAAMRSTGVATLALASLLFVRPDWLGSAWPWQLTC